MMCVDLGSHGDRTQNITLFVPAANRLYVAVPHRGDQQAEIWEYKTRETDGR
jgi:hypothetical protein